MPAPRPLRAVADRIRELPVYFSRRELAIGGVVAVAIVAGIAWALASAIGDDDGVTGGGTSVVTVVAGDGDEGEEVGSLGFPVIASRNTTRVAGADPVADAAAVALATHPPSPDAEPVEAVVMVDDDWQTGVAASVLSSEALGAPILIGASGDVPGPTADTLRQLDPRGGGGPADAQVFRAGDVEVPDGFQVTDIEGGKPSEIANSVDELRQRLTGAEPRHILLVGEDDPDYAMPAAAWAARSGDPVLFVGRDSMPEATAEALKRHRSAGVYALGPTSAISEKALREVRRVSPNVTRIGAEDPVANAIDFARYADSSFGWNINDPGHGLVLANVDRPADAGAAAALSGSGKWGPLLLTDDPKRLPDALRQFLLDIKPGYQEDPTRALYNHVWVIGDASAIGARMQADIDELVELTRIGGGGGGAAGSPGGVTAGPSIDNEVPPSQLDQPKKKP